ncbi:unnamed protein product [Caenorhabditis nigoni]
MRRSSESIPLACRQNPCIKSKSVAFAKENSKSFHAVRTQSLQIGYQERWIDVTEMPKETTVFSVEKILISSTVS